MSGGDAHLTRVHESSLTRFAPSPRAPNAAASSQHRFPVRPSSFPRPKPRGNEPDHRTPAPSDPKIPQGWRWYPGLDRPPPPLTATAHPELPFLPRGSAGATQPGEAVRIVPAAFILSSSLCPPISCPPLTP